MDDTTLSIMIKLGMQEEENAKVTLAKLESNFKALEKHANNLRKAIQVSLDHDEDAGLLKAALEDVEAQISDTTMAAAKLNREMKQAQWDNLKKIGRDLEQVGDKIANIGRGMSIMGVGILAGVYSSIQKFNADNPLDLTAQRWLAAQDDIESSFSRIGGVAADRLLPLIEKLADLAEMTADFVEKNPEMIDALVGLGSFMAVAGGGLQLAGGAMKLGGGAMNMAAKAGQAGLFAEGGALATLGTSIGTAITTVLTSTAFLASLAAGLGVVVGVGAYNKYAEATGQDSAGEIGSKGLALANFETGKILRDLGIIANQTDAELWDVSRGFAGLSTAAEAAGEAEAIAAAEKKANAEDEAAAMKKMDDLTQANAKAERKFAADREDIFTDEARAMEDANRKLSKTLTDIASSLNKDVAKIRGGLRSNLAELASNFSESNLKAEREYQTQRADIVVSGADEIKKIHQQTQKDLENAERDHSTNVAGLIANRDALGLVEENNAYAQKQADIKKNANESIAQARANTQAQLAEAAQNYAEQRAQRLADYEAQKADAKTKAAEAIAEAQAKAAEDKKRAIAAAAEQKAEIERKRIEALADLKKAYDRERKERITAVYNEIIELRGALNAEMLMRRQYQGQILADTTAHMKAMAAAQRSSSDPVHDYSGYAYTGTYAMAQDGQREFVLSGAATKAAEQMVGGQLNQQALLSGLAGQGGAGMQYVDQSTYSGMTVADVRRVRQMSRQEALSVMSEVYRK